MQTNLPLSKPSDVTAGDLMLASIAIHDGNTVTVAPPAGWTEVLRTDNDSNIGIDTYETIAGASEPSSYTWVLSPQTRAQGGITRYSGVDPSNPIDVAAGNIGRSKIATTSSITTTSANDEVVAVYALHVGSSNFAGDFFSTPTGMTEKYDSSYTTAGPTIASDDTMQATAGVTGSTSSTISGNPNQQRDWAAQTIALRMATPSIAFDNVSYANGINYSCSFSMTIGTGSHRVAIVDIQNRNASDPVSAVSIGGVSGSFVASTTGGGSLGAEMWYVVNPPSPSLTNLGRRFYPGAPSAG